MTPEDAIKSILLGITMKTNSNTAKWMNDDEWNRHLKRDEKIWKKEESNNLSYYLILSKSTHIQVYISTGYDNNGNLFNGGSWVQIKDESLNDGGYLVNRHSSYCSQEYNDFIKLMFDKYAKPVVSNYKKNYQSDLKILTNVVGLCGIEAVRDMKLNSILGDEKGWFKKIFN